VNPVLLVKAQRGDSSARAAFLQEVGPSVAALIRRLGSRNDTEDQLHDIFAHLLAVLPRFDPAGPAQLSTWVFAVAQRWLLMQKRRASPSLVSLDADASLQTHSPEPTEYVEGRQLKALLEAELARLPEEQRRVFVLTRLHEQSLDSVAEAEGVPLGTVKSRLHRARAELVLRMGPALDRPSAKGAEDGAA
jgi:RNA polymerase sigma-70 factor (ECF subfamily)